ncbi:MAG: tetratricopeptide repeat protein [Pseudomonadota bacterium]
MSLINDYLKKTQQESPPLDKSGDVPPVLRTSKKGKGSGLTIRFIGFILILVVAGVVYVKFQSPIQKTTPPPELLNPVKPVAEAQNSPPEVTPTGIKPTETSSTPIKEATSPESNEPMEAQKASPSRSYESPFEGPGETTPKFLPPSQEPLPSYNVHSTETEPTVSQPSSSEPLPSAPRVPPITITPRAKSEMQTTLAVDISHYYQLGLIAQRDGNYPEAEKFYQDVLKKDPSHGEALTNLSAVFIQQGKYSDAERTLHNLLRKEPKNTKALVNLGIIELKLNQDEQASRYFHEALNINPREETALINLAYLAQKENNPSLMEKFYQEILSIAPDNSEILLAYASLLEKNSRFRDAISCYEKSIELDEVKANEQLLGQIKERMTLLRYYNQ